MSINQRVVQLLEQVAGTKSAFSSQTGISPVILSHISSGRNKVSLTAVEQILKAYPDVNAEWLILGKGSMFKTESNKDWISALQRRIDQLDDEINQNNASVQRKIDSIRRHMDASM